MALPQAKVASLRSRTIDELKREGIKLFERDMENIEIADFGLGKPEEFGVQLVIHIDNDRYCVKDVLMFPWQTVPEHKHPGIQDGLGKRETFRCLKGSLFLYVPGPPTKEIKAKVSETKKDYFTVYHEIILNPGDMYTIEPNTLHWFQAGPQGAVFSEYSTANTDKYDQYTDPEVKRIPQIQP